TLFRSGRRDHVPRDHRGADLLGFAHQVRVHGARHGRHARRVHGDGGARGRVQPCRSSFPECGDLMKCAWIHVVALVDTVLDFGSAVTRRPDSVYDRRVIDCAVGSYDQTAALRTDVCLGYTGQFCHGVANRSLATTATHACHLIFTCLHTPAPFMRSALIPYTPRGYNSMKRFTAP